MGMDPQQPERGDGLNLETCVDSTFEVAPRIKRNSCVPARTTLYWSNSPWSCPCSQVDESFCLYNLLDCSVLSY